MTPRLGFCLVFSIVFAIGALSLAAIARAESGMEWQFFQTNDPGNKSTRLIYGVPETDNLQVSGACVHSSSIGANFSIVTFGADIGDLENGKDTSCACPAAASITRSRARSFAPPAKKV
jgi:hypothetical protein